MHSQSQAHHEAYQAEAPVRIAWRDREHQLHCVVGRCIDVTEKRIHIQVRERVPLNEQVSLLGEGMKQARQARVRYVTSYNNEFILVLDRAGV
jgi:hypothetical protein